MAGKKQRKKQEEPQVRQLSKQEKEMFSMKNCAHDSRGSPIDWGLIKSLWNI